MKAFFMEYGKLIITGALTVTGLMFSTPFAEAVTGSVANFTSRFSEKNEESMEHVTIGLDGSGGGSSPIVDGTNIILSNDADGNGVVSKGDTLTFATSYLYSGSNTGPTEFLVLKSDGSTAELMAKTNYQTKRFNGTPGGATDSAYKTVLKYEGSELDTLLNETYYNTLSDTIKGKIQSQPITQNSWNYSASLADYDAQITRLDSSVYKYKKVGTVGTYNRNVYAIDVKDVLDYIGTNGTGADLNNMFFGTTSAVSKCAWLRSAYSYGRSYAFNVYGNDGYMGSNGNYSAYEVRPAFKLSLN